MHWRSHFKGTMSNRHRRYCLVVVVVQIINIVREYVFYVFFENPKKRDFLRFFEAAFQKRRKNVIQNFKFQNA